MPKVGLDIGHGRNTYPPNKGVPSMPEFEFNNAVAKVAKPLLESYGIEVVMAQPFDANDVPLRTRSNLYNSENVDIVMSIHADANPNSSARGFWPFHWHTSSNGRRLATIWADELKSTQMRFRSIQASRPNHWTNFHILRETNMPAVLMEHGFMTNPSDLKLLKSDRYRREAGEALARTAARYFGIDVDKAQPFDGVRRGDSGAEVRKVQQLTLDLGYELPRFGVDGSYGDETSTAIRQVQRDFSLPVTGDADRATINKMEEVLRIMARVFKDVQEGHWAEDYVKTVKEEKLMEGFEDDTFRGDDSVTRYQLAAVIARLLDK